MPALFTSMSTAGHICPGEQLSSCGSDGLLAGEVDPQRKAILDIREPTLERVDALLDLGLVATGEDEIGRGLGCLNEHVRLVLVVATEKQNRDSPQPYQPTPRWREPDSSQIDTSDYWRSCPEFSRRRPWKLQGLLSDH